MRTTPHINPPKALTSLCWFLAFITVLCGAIDAVSAANNTAPQTLQNKRRLSLSTGLLTCGTNQTFFNCIEAWENFYIQVNQGRTALFDIAAATDWGQTHRGLLLLIDLIPEVFFFTSTVIPYHEWAHAFSARAAGYTNAYMLNKYGAQNDTRYYNPLSLSLRHIFSPFTMPASQKGQRTWVPESSFEGVDEVTRRDILSAFEANGEQGVENYCNTNAATPSVQHFQHNENDLAIMRSAAGFNAQVAYAGALDDLLYEHQGHVTDGLFYMANKLANAFVPTNGTADIDLQNVLAGYAHKGYSITRQHINTASILSSVLSSSTYAYITSLINFLHTGSSQATPFEAAGIRLPDIESYMLAEGLSVLIKTGYRFSETLHFPVSVEFLVKGAKGAEISIACEKKIPSLNRLALGGELTFGRAFDFALFARMPIGKSFFIEGRTARYALKGFKGQRRIPSLEKGHDAYSVELRAGLRY